MSPANVFPLDGGCDCRTVRYRMEAVPLFVVLLARRRVRCVTPQRWAVLVGAASAGAVLAAALWVNDVDPWTAAALVLLPAVAALVLRFTRSAA
jgi:hypothetical protein